MALVSKLIQVLMTFISFLIVLLLLLQCSFRLAQNKSEDPFSLAIQIYQASGLSAQLSETEKELFVKYSAAKNGQEKVKLVMDVISHHSFCML